MAGRTWEEHWYAYQPANEPYFRRAGQLFTADAADHGDPAAVQAVTAKLNNPGALEVTFAPSATGVPTRAVTTESSITVVGELQPTQGSMVPAGTAVRRSMPGTGLSLPTDPKAVVPVTVAAKPTSFSTLLSNDLLAPSEATPPQTPTPVTSGLTEFVLYRGQRVQSKLPVTIYPRPFVTVNTFPSPTLASVGIRATPDVQERFGQATGTVVFVLDCSGSMGVPAGETFGPTAKFSQATKVLSEVLADLPAGTKFSVWAFGQRSDTTLTAADAERTIARVVPVTVRKENDAKQLADVMAKVDYPALVPWNESPILRSMLAAKADFKSETGYKTMVVVTDGMDNRFKTDKVLNPKGESIPALLREEFDGSGITAHVIGFKLAEPEEDVVRKQFDTVQTLDPPGTFTDTDNAEELGRAIRRALRQSVRFWIETPANVIAPAVPKLGLEVGTDGGGDRWFRNGLKPGAWKLRVLDRPYLVAESFLAPADRLLLDLVPQGSGLALRRAAWTATDFPTRPWAAARDWRFSLIQNQQAGAGYRGLAVLERKFDPGETVLQVPHPREIWFNLKPADPNADPIAVEWHRTPGYPAAAWTAHLAGLGRRRGRSGPTDRDQLVEPGSGADRRQPGRPRHRLQDAR